MKSGLLSIYGARTLRVWCRDMTHVSPVAPQSALDKYVKDLVCSAEEYEKAKAAGNSIRMAASALGSIRATLTFLREVQAPGHVAAPFYEASDLIKNAVVPARIMRGFDALPHHQYEKVIQAVAVWFLIQCGMDEDGACRRALGKNEPEAIKALKKKLPWEAYTEKNTISP